MRADELLMRMSRSMYNSANLRQQLGHSLLGNGGGNGSTRFHPAHLNLAGQDSNASGAGTRCAGAGSAGGRCCRRRGRCRRTEERRWLRAAACGVRRHGAYAALGTGSTPIQGGAGGAGNQMQMQMQMQMQGESSLGGRNATPSSRDAHHAL